MADYKSYLAARILTEDNAVTYRLLSRVLKVHVNDAKEMLYEFHKSQNQKKPGSIHATYLISGTKRKEDPPATIGGVKDEDGDDYMQSSPFMGSSMLQPEQDQGTGESSVLSITLVREKDLENLRSEYEQINSIHIYSLEPNPLKDLQILSDVTRELQELCASEDALETLSTYGAITNPSAKRRATRKPPPPAATQSKPAPPKSKPVEAKPLPKKEEPKSQPSTAKDFFGKGGKAKESAKPKSTAASTSSKESTPNPPALKKESSSLFKSFAKAKAKSNPEGEGSSAAASPAVSTQEDSPMKDVVSSDEDDDEPFIPAPPKEEIDRNRRQRKEREEALRKMMEDDDEEEEEDTPAPTAKVAEPEEEEEEEEEEAPKSKSKAVSEEKEEAPVVSDGRRRGRRRVMKKKTVKDEDGYLVTKEEMTWESFSEDEPVAKPKPKPQASIATRKKPAAKAGQGSIMSFFGKK